MLALIGFALVGAAPVAAAPFVYVTYGGCCLAQFDAPLSTFEALKPLKPATVATPDGLAMAVSPDGKSVYLTKFFGQAVLQYSIDPRTGVLSPKSPATVAAGVNPDGVAVSPDGKSVYVANNDQSGFGGTISQYSIDPSTGKLSPKSPATVANAGNPTALAVAPDGKSAYVANEGGRTVSQYSIDPSTGVLTPKSPATVAAGPGAGGVAVTPDGKSAYVTNFSGTSIPGTVSQYSINPSTGKLSPKSPATVATGSEPFALAVTPDGKSAYVANFSGDSVSGTVSQYSINPTTGKLSPKSPATVPAGNEPLAVAVTPDGKSAYVANQGGGPVGIVSQYSIHPQTGVLSPKSPATVAAGDSFLSDVAVSPDADMSVKLGAPVSVKSGSRLTYTITVVNRGPSSAWRVTLKDVLPYGTQFQTASATSGRCTTPKTGRKGGTVTCKLGKIKRGETPEVRVVAEVTASANQGEIADTAIVSSVTPDPNYRNNRHHRRTKVTK